MLVKGKFEKSRHGAGPTGGHDGLLCKIERFTVTG